jgi:glucoamylase
VFLAGNSIHLSITPLPFPTYVLQSYWDPKTSHIIANINLPSHSPHANRTGLDANTVLASIHTFDPAAGCDNLTFQPCSERALVNLLAYINSFREVYKINHDIPKEKAVGIATGRYKEDWYMGGNVGSLSFCYIKF